MEVKKIVGYKRDTLNKNQLEKLRKEGNVPGVMYGGKCNINFSVPYYILQDIVYTNKKYLIKFILDNKEYNCILKEIQFHPVSDIIIHIDLLEVDKNRKITEQINILKLGIPIGVKNGGLLMQKKKKLLVKGSPYTMPSVIEIDISNLDGGDTLRIKQLPEIDGCEYIEQLNEPIFTLKAPRKA